MIHRYLINAVWMLVVCTIWFQLQQHYENYLVNKGIANATYLNTYHAQLISPEDARFYQLYMTTYDLKIDDLTIFEGTTYTTEGKKK